MTDIVDIGLRVDSSDVKTASRDLDNLGTSSAGANRATDSLIGSFKGAMAAAAAYYATLKLVIDPLMQSIEAANEAAQAQAKLSAVLKATGSAAGLTKNQLNDLADQLANSTLFDDETIRNAEAVLLSFRNVQGDTFREGISLATDMASLFGGDLQSSVMQLGKALNEPTEGVTALSRAGVTFSAVQKDQIKNFVETNQLAKAQALILNEIRDQLGGTADAMAKEDNGIVAMKKSFGELAETIGNRALPMVQAIASELKFVADQLKIRITPPTDMVDIKRAELDAIRAQIKELGPLEWSARRRLELQERDVMHQYTVAVTLAAERKKAEEEAAKKAAEIAAQKEREARAQAKIREEQEKALDVEFLRAQQQERELNAPTIMGPDAKPQQIAEGVSTLQKSEAMRMQQEAMEQDTAQKLAFLESSLMTEEERIAQSYMNRQFIVETAFQNGQINEQTHHSLSVQLWAQAEAEKSLILEREIKHREALEKSASEARIQLLQQGLGAAAALLEGRGRAAFDVQKALRIAETIISAHASAQKAYESQLSIPTPDAPARAAAAAGIAYAFGAAKVAAIARTKYGSSSMSGGGAGGVSGSNGGASSTGNTSTNQSTPTRSGSQVTYNIYGQSLAGPTLQEFLDSVSESVNRGDQVIFNYDSRQARVLRGEAV